MKLTSVDPPSQWRAPHNVERAARYLIALVDEHLDVHIGDLSRDPIDALESCSHIDFRWTQQLSGEGCEQYGYYRHNPPTIGVRRTNRARANFTALHEFAHYLQQSDADWALDVLLELPKFDAAVLQEAVCDQFASLVLVPDELLAMLRGREINSAAVAELHEASSGSRRVAAKRTLTLATSPTMFILTDPSGNVEWVETNSETLIGPSKGTAQPDLARLADLAATSGYASDRTRTGLIYSTGNVRSDLSLDATPGTDGLHVFHRAVPIYKFGDQQWSIDQERCSNEACNELFLATPERFHVPCGAFKCPECGACSCEPKKAVSCDKCFMELSVEEMAKGLSRHDDC